MGLQQAVVRAGVAVVQGKQLQPSPWFHYAVLETMHDLPTFTRPMALGRLALFILDALQERVRRPPSLVLRAAVV
jgi:hypothetical protein